MSYPLPARLNLAIVAAQVIALITILVTVARAGNWGAVAALAVAYAVVMNSAYAMLHEAQHNLLHPDRVVNETCGVLLALFFPAPFHLMRQGHILHHIQNRSDAEAFDCYFDGDNALWKRLQLYGILTGAFWLVLLLANVLVLFVPLKALQARSGFDRPTEALLTALNPKYMRLIRVEAAAAIALHATIVTLTGASPLHYFAVLFGFGATWSAMQYVHHFGTVRDVRRGALNLKTFPLLDRLWLNHNWHLHHHLHPTAPWTALPYLEAGPHTPRHSLLRQYFTMWQGPHFTSERVDNRYAGTVIR